jgi:hypothetical protein
MVLQNITLYDPSLWAVRKLLSTLHGTVYEFSNTDCGLYLQYAVRFPFDRPHLTVFYGQF